MSLLLPPCRDERHLRLLGVYHESLVFVSVFVFSGTYPVPVDTEVNVTFLSALAFFLHAAKLEFYSQRPWILPFQQRDCLGLLSSSSDCLEFLGGRSISCLFLAAGSVCLLCSANILRGGENICFIRRKNKSWLGRTLGNASANST